MLILQQKIFFGIYCNETCSCINGICDDAVNGTGTCVNCSADYYGKYCNDTCLCVHGNCSMNQSCICNENYLGILCNEKCIDSKCSITCVCSDNNCTCENDINIQNTTSLYDTQIEINGNINVEDSNITFSSVVLSIMHNFTLSNSTIEITSSSITVKGCINLNNTNLIINVPKSTNSSNQDINITLFNSETGCLMTSSLNITFLNQSKCAVLKTITDTFSLVLNINTTSCIASTHQTNSWLIPFLIIICSVVGAAILFLILAFAIPKLKNKLFPHANYTKNDSINTERNDMVLNDLQQSMKEVESDYQVKSMMESRSENI